MLYRFWHTFLLIIPAFCHVKAQQLPIFTQYREYATFLNPAAITSDFFMSQHAFSASASYRLQWEAVEGSPQTQLLQANTMLQGGQSNALLLGGTLLHDQTGPLSALGAYGRMGGLIAGDVEEGGVSLGLSLGVVQYRLDASKIRLRDNNDVLPFENQSKVIPDIGAGVFAYRNVDESNLYYGGLSVPQLAALSWSVADKISYRRVPHAFANVGWYRFFEEGRFLETSSWVKYSFNAPLDADINVRYQMVSNFWLGMGTSLSKKLHFETGFILGERTGQDYRVKIGYGFDYSISAYAGYLGAAHELNISFSR
jgi:type IX secretion system PorP/SprF family membrane protein